MGGLFPRTHAIHPIEVLSEYELRDISHLDATSYVTTFKANILVTMSNEEENQDCGATSQLNVLLRFNVTVRSRDSFLMIIDHRFDSTMPFHVDARDRLRQSILDISNPLCALESPKPTPIIPARRNVKLNERSFKSSGNGRYDQNDLDSQDLDDECQRILFEGPGWVTGAV